MPFPPLTVDPASAGPGDRGARAAADAGSGCCSCGSAVTPPGVFDGDRGGRDKVGSRQVHGRSAAGGWSQQRFARRREGQVRVALAAAADLAATLLVPEAATLDAVVLGGDRRSVDTVLADAAAGPAAAAGGPPLLDVPDPRQAVLELPHPVPGRPGRGRRPAELRTDPADAPALDTDQT